MSKKDAQAKPLVTKLIPMADECKQGCQLETTCNAWLAEEQAWKATEKKLRDALQKIAKLADDELPLSEYRKGIKRITAIAEDALT